MRNKKCIPKSLAKALAHPGGRGYRVGRERLQPSHKVEFKKKHILQTQCYQTFNVIYVSA